MHGFDWPFVSFNWSNWKFWQFFGSKPGIQVKASFSKARMSYNVNCRLVLIQLTFPDNLGLDAWRRKRFQIFFLFFFGSSILECVKVKFMLLCYRTIPGNGLWSSYLFWNLKCYIVCISLLKELHMIALDAKSSWRKQLSSIFF